VGNYCVCCGNEIPEGKMVCPYCEWGINGKESGIGQDRKIKSKQGKAVKFRSLHLRRHRVG
jgi:hypothetical protein